MLENVVDFGPMRTIGIYTPLDYIPPKYTWYLSNPLTGSALYLNGP
jgi:hypothetical protein